MTDKIVYTLIDNAEHYTMVKKAYNYQQEAYNNFMKNMDTKYIENIKYRFGTDIVFTIRRFNNKGMGNINVDRLCVMINEKGDTNILSDDIDLIQKIASMKNRLCT